jgi:hypothetical protein
MKAQTAKRMIRLQEWAFQIKECKQSGQSVKIWCGEHGINLKTYYNRMKVVREEMLEFIDGGINLNNGINEITAGSAASCQNRGGINRTVLYGQPKAPVFAALPLHHIKTPAITVRIGKYEIDVGNGADTSVLDHVLHSVTRLC